MFNPLKIVAMDTGTTFKSGLNLGGFYGTPLDSGTYIYIIV